MNSKQPPKNNTTKAGTSTKVRLVVVKHSSLKDSTLGISAVVNDANNYVTKKNKGSAAQQKSPVRINHRCSPRGSINQDANSRPKPDPPPSSLLPSTK